jgi:hypothetical protein
MRMIAAGNTTSSGIRPEFGGTSEELHRSRIGISRAAMDEFHADRLQSPFPPGCRHSPDDRPSSRNSNLMPVPNAAATPT